MNILKYIFKNKKITLILFIFYLGYFCLNSGKFVVLAQTEKYNPLESPQSDPLLPPKEIDRPLTALEKRVIRETTILLNNQAKSELAAGNKDQAFSLWYRQLRLNRALGKTEEINALGQVGEIAWQQNFSQELNIISDRLLTIQQEVTVENPLYSQLLYNLGQSYQQVRDLDRAVIIYQKILQNNRQEDNFQEEQKSLETLGKLYLAQFDYTQAAKTYEELLKLFQTQQQKNSPVTDNYVWQNKTSNSSLKKETYLTKLLEIYDRLSQPAKAIEIKQQLFKKYLAEQKTEQLAALKISLATDYQILKQPEKAQKYYEDAFTLAWSLQQFSLAQQSLQKLALLYQEYQQPTAALKIYQELIKVEKKAYSYFDLMNTYHRIGQIYEQLSNSQQALASYEKGLELAQSLNYRIDYFQNKIKELENNSL